ncbi:MAG: hypothetical protein JRJ58_17300 [Deltaproteobacteria bacterium]|nr:hypothetical protein [Deltaproteobacteria bacterium]
MESSCTRPARRVSSLRLIAVVALLGSIAALFGCANGEIRLGDPFDRKYALEEAQHRYTVLVRWSNFQKAKSFVAGHDREAYMQRMKTLSDARFTGYESAEVEFDDGNRKATIEVVYTLILPSNPYETEITESQEWTRDLVMNNWQVVSTFDRLAELASN